MEMAIGGGGTARNARKFQGFRGKQLSLFYKLGYPSYLHGIDGFSFNESFYKDKDRVRRVRNSLAKLYEEARDVTGAQE